MNSFPFTMAIHLHMKRMKFLYHYNKQLQKVDLGTDDFITRVLFGITQTPYNEDAAEPKKLYRLLTKNPAPDFINRFTF